MSPRSLLATVLGCIFLLGATVGCAGDAQQADLGSKPPAGGYPVSHPGLAPDFALEDQDGRTVRLSKQRGKLVVVTFLYTHCPDVCPLIAENLNRALRELGSKRSEVGVLAVSVDPKGDTPRAVRAFVRTHHLLPEFRYLTGGRSELRRVWRAYDVIAVSRKPKLVDHSTVTLLVDRAGKKRFVYPADFKTAAVLHDIRELSAS
jgi:protein SCO1